MTRADPIRAALERLIEALDDYEPTWGCFPESALADARAALDEQQGEGPSDIPPGPFSEHELRDTALLCGLCAAAAGGGATVKGYGIEFGAPCDDIEVQLQRQGCTLGDQAERVQRWANEISSLRIHGLLTQAESDRARRRLWKELTRAVKPLPAAEVE